MARDKSGPVGSQFKVTLLRMFRELYKVSAAKGKPLSRFGMNEGIAEAGLLSLLDSMTEKQVELVLNAVIAFGMHVEGLDDADRRALVTPIEAPKWVREWMVEHAGGVEVTETMPILVLGTLMAAIATTDNEQAMIDILSPEEFVKMKAEMAQTEKGAQSHAKGGKFDA